MMLEDQSWARLGEEEILKHYDERIQPTTASSHEKLFIWRCGIDVISICLRRGGQTRRTLCWSIPAMRTDPCRHYQQNTAIRMMSTCRWQQPDYSYLHRFECTLVLTKEKATIVGVLERTNCRRSAARSRVFNQTLEFGLVQVISALSPTLAFYALKIGHTIWFNGHACAWIAGRCSNFSPISC